MFAVIVSENVPVGETDSAVVGHLWLMFASRCYWSGLNTDRLTPVYDWQASVAAHGQYRKVRAVWDFLSGPGSLPQEVRYLGQWDETNGFYKITGSNSVNGNLIPTGFIFEQFRFGPVNENTFIHNMELVKRVDVEVTAIRPRCSRAILIPSPDGPAVVVDRRFESGISNRPPSYRNPIAGEWPGIEKSKELAAVQQAADLHNLARMEQSRLQKKSGPSAHSSKVVLIVMLIFLTAPPILYVAWRKQGKS
jgi:hypothetical protein